MPKVYNKHHNDAPPEAVYVGRPTKWGNPWSIGGRCPREEAIRFYKETVFSRHTKEEIQSELRGKDLVCWCAPKPCHADILLEIANQEAPTSDV